MCTPNKDFVLVLVDFYNRTAGNVILHCFCDVMFNKITSCSLMTLGIDNQFLYSKRGRNQIYISLRNFLELSLGHLQDIRNVHVVIEFSLFEFLRKVDCLLNR